MTHMDPETVAKVSAADDLAEDMKDPEFVGVEVELQPRLVFSYAGASIASQNMLICMGVDGCGGLLREDQQTRHEQWHAAGRP